MKFYKALIITLSLLTLSNSYVKAGQSAVINVPENYQNIITNDTSDMENTRDATNISNIHENNSNITNAQYDKSCRYESGDSNDSLATNTTNLIARKYKTLERLESDGFDADYEDNSSSTSSLLSINTEKSLLYVIAKQLSDAQHFQDKNITELFSKLRNAASLVSKKISSVSYLCGNALLNGLDWFGDGILEFDSDSDDD